MATPSETKTDFAIKYGIIVFSNKYSLIFLALGEFILFSRNHSFSFEFIRNCLIFWVEDF